MRYLYLPEDCNNVKHAWRSKCSGCFFLEYYICTYTYIHIYINILYICNISIIYIIYIYIYIIYIYIYISGHKGWDPWHTECSNLTEAKWAQYICMLLWIYIYIYISQYLVLLFFFGSYFHYSVGPVNTISEINSSEIPSV